MAMGIVAAVRVSPRPDAIEQTACLVLGIRAQKTPDCHWLYMSAPDSRRAFKRLGPGDGLRALPFKACCHRISADPEALQPEKRHGAPARMTAADYPAIPNQAPERDLPGPDGCPQKQPI